MTLDARIEQCRRSLEEACAERGFWISGDGRVGEADVAALIGIAPGSLANKRYSGTAPKHSRLAGHGHRITYALDEVAKWIAGYDA